VFRDEVALEGLAVQPDERLGLSVCPGRERDVLHGIAFLVHPWGRVSGSGFRVGVSGVRFQGLLAWG